MSTKLFLLSSSMAVMALVAPSAQSPLHVVEPPAGEGSGMYALAHPAAPDRPSTVAPHAILSWIEPLPSGEHALRFAAWEGRGWSRAGEVARGRGWFVNWADHPSVVMLPDRSLLAHWLVRSGDRTSKYGYGVHVARSTDASTWSEIFAADPQGTDYAGFVSFLPTPDGFAAAYLAPAADARLAVHGGGDHDGDHPEPIKTLVWTRFDARGAALGTDVLDVDVCSCCSTAAAMTRRGPILAYRDRTPGEVRDIAVVRHVNGRWTTPRVVHADGWTIPGCPTNGPALAAAGDDVVIAWFTAAGGKAHVRVAFSPDGGATFAPPVTVDDGMPIGWTGVVLTEGGDAIVSWLEGRPGGGGQVRVRRVSANARIGAAITVADTQGGRATGIPQMVRAGADLIVAWRDGRVRAAVLPIGAVPPPR